MKTYEINDINAELFSHSTVIVEAQSPFNAVKKSGYKNIKRKKTGQGGHIVVYGPYGTYLYSGEKK